MKEERGQRQKDKERNVIDKGKGKKVKRIREDTYKNWGG